MKIKSLIIVAVLVMATLSFGFVANAQTTNVQALIAQLQAQIANLMAQLQALQAQQNGTQTWCHTFNNNLKVGDGGLDGGARLANDIDKDVSALKQALNKQGLYDLNIDQPGTAGSSMKETYFNEQLASAVVAFQEKYASEVLAPYGLKHGTGYVGATTRKKLNALYGCGTSTSVCTPNWQCTAWSVCTNNQQIRTCSDSNNCGVTTGQPSTLQTCVANQSSITITSPNGGEIWKVGETHNITWISSGITGNVTIYRGSATGAFSMSAFQIANVPASSGTYSWTVDKYAVGLDAIQIVGSNGITGTSNSFTVTNSTQTSGTITSPKSGDVWEVGKTYNVVWNPSVFDDKVSIALVNRDNNKVCDFDGIENTGTHTFVVPTQTGFGSCDDGTNISGNNYQIRVWTKAATLYSPVFSVSNPSGLQTYVNNNVGYTVQYPSAYTATVSNCYLWNGQTQVNDTNSIIIGDQNIRLVQICYFDGTAQNFFNNFGDNNYVSTTFNGYAAYKDVLDYPYGGGGTKYIIQKDASHIIFINEGWSGSLKDTADNIVSTIILK